MSYRLKNIERERGRKETHSGREEFINKEQENKRDRKKKDMCVCVLER